MRNTITDQDWIKPAITSLITIVLLVCIAPVQIDSKLFWVVDPWRSPNHTLKTPDLCNSCIYRCRWSLAFVCVEFRIVQISIHYLKLASVCTARSFCSAGLLQSFSYLRLAACIPLEKPLPQFHFIIPHLFLKGVSHRETSNYTELFKKWEKLQSTS